MNTVQNLSRVNCIIHGIAFTACYESSLHKRRVTSRTWLAS